MKSTVQDREFDKFRSADGDKSKVAVSLESDSSGLIVDNASSTIIYIGEGTYGALTSEPKWLIKRIDLASGVVIKAASKTFDQIWDNRASLTYV